MMHSQTPKHLTAAHHSTFSNIPTEFRGHPGEKSCRRRSIPLPKMQLSLVFLLVSTEKNMPLPTHCSLVFSIKRGSKGMSAT